MNGEKRESAGNGHQEMIPGSETGRKAAGAREKWRRLAEAFSGRSTPELRRKSPVVDLSEMAAMSFARELLGLDSSPYMLDVLLVYAYDKEAAWGLYEEIGELIRI